MTEMNHVANEPRVHESGARDVLASFKAYRLQIEAVPAR
jgi:hypothetical protein